MYLYGRWLLSGPSATPRGTTPVPGWMELAVWSHLLIGIPATVFMVYVVAVKPWRATRRMSDDALYMFAIATMFWQDLLMNYLHYTVVYTTAWPNLGSWNGYIPGWPNPHGNLVSSAAIFFWPMYILVLFGFTSAAQPVLRWAHERRPAMGKRAMFGVAFALALVTNLTLEAGWARMGLYVFASTIKPLTLFAGKYYQYPLYHGIIWAASWAGLTVLRYYRSDTGLTAADRGVDSLRVRGSGRTVVRFFALAGAVNAIFLAYNLSTGLIHTQSGEWISDIAEKSYYTNGLCLPENFEPKLDYVCANSHEAKGSGSRK